MSDKSDRAANLLNHYFGIMMRKEVGISPDSDTTAEVFEIVDSIIAASVEETKKQIMEDLKAKGLLK